MPLFRHVEHDRLDIDLDAVSRGPVLDPGVTPQRAEQAMAAIASRRQRIDELIEKL